MTCFRQGFRPVFKGLGKRLRLVGDSFQKRALYYVVTLLQRVLVGTLHDLDAMVDSHIDLYISYNMVIELTQMGGLDDPVSVARWWQSSQR